ncbi:zf-DHHC-domain-containing protein [Cystobasidium minutum MCA 4210]|uniref:zf-DHHC-domain-containing protein n=1 Tax=Cystobasidium minutum MCA 4210 TaxID=1397322 RepID=UPI0034CEE796|eukprot:jgi/Rhomi1/110707/CE110706_1887
MKLLTRYPHTGSITSVLAAVCLPSRHDPASTPAPKRASFLVRLPYYIFLTSMGAVYYGYVISLNLRWLILQQQRIWLSFTFLSIFHFLFIMFMWSLLATVYRGPGAVGEVLIAAHPTIPEDLEAGLSNTNESAPLMQNIEEPAQTATVISTSNGLSGSQGWRQRSSSKSGSNTGSIDEHDEAQDYLELQPKVDYGDSSDDDDEAEGDETGESSSKSKSKKKRDRHIEIIYPGELGTSLTAKANGKARFCRKCNVAKPDRSHHCSTCGFCVLKMDHHCPWIGGCVGFKNYKTFILFLFYADLLAVYTCATSFWALVQVLDMDIEELGLAPVGWGFLVLFGFLFSVMLTGFFPYHLYLSVNNRSTIENMERNGRLLSLPTKAESMLSAGVTDPHAAGLPERPRSGAGSHLLPNAHSSDVYRPGQPRPPPPGFEDSSSSYRSSSVQQQRNPFLPSTAAASLSSNLTHNTFESSAALSSLSRTAKRDLERKAGKINIYDLGTWQANFMETFGSDWNTVLAWIPVGKSNGSGYEWPVNKRHFEKLKAINEQLRLPSSGAV